MKSKKVYKRCIKVQAIVCKSMQQFIRLQKFSKISNGMQKDANIQKKGTIMQNFIRPMYKMMAVYFEG